MYSFSQLKIETIYTDFNGIRFADIKTRKSNVVYEIKDISKRLDC